MFCGTPHKRLMYLHFQTCGCLILTSMVYMTRFKCSCFSRAVGMGDFQLDPRDVCDWLVELQHSDLWLRWVLPSYYYISLDCSCLVSTCRSPEPSFLAFESALDVGLTAVISVLWFADAGCTLTGLCLGVNTLRRQHKSSTELLRLRRKLASLVVYKCTACPA